MVPTGVLECLASMVRTFVDRDTAVCRATGSTCNPNLEFLVCRAEDPNLSDAGNCDSCFASWISP